jgi:cell division protein ZapA (FtsZ GTPase activity inhibitor)
MEKSGLRIDLLGTCLSIAADEDSAYLESLLNRYRIVIENTQKSTGLTDPLKIAVLTGFLLCDEIEKTKKLGQLGEREGKEAERLTLDLIARIDEVIPGSSSQGQP